MIATTKIPVLTGIASLFDPLGYLTPTTVKMRLFLQNLWIQEKGWDDQLENGDIETWQKTIIEMIELSFLYRGILEMKLRNFSVFVMYQRKHTLLPFT